MKKPRVPMTRILNAISNRDIDFYKRLSDEDKKSISFYTLIRYTSSVDHDNPEIEYAFIERSNEFINKNYFNLQAEKDLIWKLYASIGIGSPVRYNYLKAPSKLEPDKFEKLLCELYPSYKMEDIKFLSSMMNEADREELFDKMGFDKKQRKEYQ
jgi:hypothetical protein